VTSEQFTVKIATVVGKYPDEAGSNTLTFTHSVLSSNKVADYELERAENYPLELRVKFWNKDGGLVGGGYNATLGTGNIVSGLQVQCWLYSTLSVSYPRFFHGEIVSTKQTGDGLLEVTCLSPLAKLDRCPIDKYWVAGPYREEYERLLVYAATPTWPARIDTLDTTWVSPPLFVSVCLRQDPRVYSGTRTSSVTLNNGSKMYAQSFSGKDGDHINLWNISGMCDAANTATLRIGIIECDPLTGPTGAWICYYDMTTLPNDGVWYGVAYYPDNDTGDGFKYADRLRPDKQYAIVVKAVGDTSTVHIHIGTDGGTFDPKAWYYDGASWAQQTYNFAVFALDFAPWDEIEVNRAYKNASYTDEMWIDGQGRNDIPDTNAYYERACVSYFYGTFTKKDVMDNLIWLVGSVVNPNVDTGITDTFGIYKTMGKSPLECLRQIADLEEGGLSSRQLVVYDYWLNPTGPSYVYVRGKYKTSDASVATFSDTGTTDEEYRIVDYDLTKADALKINTVELRGEGGNKRPIFASAVDWTNRALFGANTYRLTDKNFTNYEDCLREAKRILAAINRTQWEGTITVAGNFPDLIDDTVGAVGTVRGGNIITLNISTLHITATKFKVRSVTCGPGKTIIAITNYDYSRQDELDAKRIRSRLAENFVGGDDVVKEYYLPARLASAVTDASLYMELQTAAGAAIAGQARVLCTKTTEGTINTYHAVFEPGNAYTASNTPIGKIVLYDALTAGTAKGTVTLGGCEYFYKLKITRVSVDVFTNTS
jgi:hypothetical protein